MAKWYFKVEGGDFTTGLYATYSEGWFSTKLYLRRFGGFQWVTYSDKDVESVELVTEETQKKSASTAGLVIAGWLLAGPFGAAAGAEAADKLDKKQKRKMIFAVKFTDGKVVVGSSDLPAFLKLKGLGKR